MTYLYHATLKKSTASIASCKSFFTSPNESCLIVAKQSAIELYAIPNLNDSELTLIEELPVHGVVLSILPIRFPKDDVDSLVILTNEKKMHIIKYVRTVNKDSSPFKVLACGTLEDRSNRHCEHGFHMRFEPTHCILTISMFDGILKFVDLSDVARSKKDGIFNLTFDTLRIDDMPVFSIAFLDDQKPKPSLAVLSLDKGREMSYGRLRIFEIDFPIVDHPLHGKSPDAIEDRELETVCEIVIPVPQPLGGFLLAGRESITYRNQNIVANAGLNFEKVSNMLAWGSVDPYRYIIADMAGNLIMVQLITDSPLGRDIFSPNTNEIVTALNVERLGTASQASSITYLDFGMVFIGSLFGDSMVIQLTTTKQQGNHFKERIWLENHAPVVDMEVLNREVFSQATMITMSGAYQDGSIRIIQNGVGVQERLEVQGDQWKSIWSVRLEQEKYHDCIVINEVGSTLLGELISADEMQPLVLEGIQQNLETRYSAMVASGVLLQAATDGLYFVASQRLAKGKLLKVWKPSSSEISHCTSYGNQIIVASIATLYYLKVYLEHNESNEGIPTLRIEVVSEVRLENDIACVDMTPFDTNVTTVPQPGADVPTPSPSTPSESKLVVVCLWNSNEALLLALPSLQLIQRQSLGSQWLARSVLIAELVPGLVFLLIALCNGQLLYCNMDIHSGELGDLRSITVGDGPMKLTQWVGSNGRHNVFVSSKYPCIVYAHNNRFTLTPVNTKSVDHMCAYNGEKYHKDNLVLLRGDNLYFVKVDDIKKMHTRKINLHESGRRVLVSERDNLLIAASVRYEHVLLAPNVTTTSTDSKANKTSRITRSSVGPSTSSSSAPMDGAMSIHRVSLNEDDVKYQPVSEESISLKGVAGIRTNGPKCSSVDNVSKKQCLNERQVSSLLVYNLRNLSLNQVHTFSHSSRYYESAFSLLLCSPSELEGITEHLLQPQVISENQSSGSAVIAAEVQAAIKRRNALSTLSFSNKTNEFDQVDNNRMEFSDESTTAIPTDLPMTLLIVGTSIQGTEAKSPSSPWFGRIHILLWCGSQQNPHFETILVKDITGVPYCMALQHGCLLVGVNSSLRCYHFEEEQLKEVCDMFQDITLITSIEVKDNYIVLADMIRSLVVLNRKKDDKKFSKISSHKRSRWVSCMKVLDPCNFLMSDSDMNMVVLSRLPNRGDAITPSKKMRIDNSESSAVDASGNNHDNYASDSAFPTRADGGGGPSSADSRLPAFPFPLLKETALFHLGESVNVYKRGSMRTATMDEIKYFSDSLLYGSVSGHIGYLLRIADSHGEVFDYLQQIENTLLKLMPNHLGYSSLSSLSTYREWRQYRIKNLCVPQTNVVDGDIIERYLDLNQELKAQICQSLKLPKFLSQNVDDISSNEVRNITVDELSSFVEQLKRSH